MKHLWVFAVAFAATCPSAPAQWSASFSQNQMDREKRITLDAAGDLGDTFIIRCGNRLQVYISTQSVVDSDYESPGEQRIRYRTDEGKPERQTWSESTDHEALFASDPASFLRSISKAKSFYFEYRPFERVADTEEFNISGLDAQLSKYYECRRLTTPPHGTKSVSRRAAEKPAIGVWTGSTQ